MSLAGNSHGDKKVVEAPSVEFLLKQVYLAHREKVKALEAEVHHLKTGSSKCLQCETLQKNLEQLKKDYQKVLQMQEEKIEVLEYHLSITNLGKEQNERTLLNSSTALESDMVTSLAPSTSQILKNDILSVDNANCFHLPNAREMTLPLHPSIPKQFVSGAVLNKCEVPEKELSSVPCLLSEEGKVSAEKEINLSTHHFKKSLNSIIFMHEPLRDEELSCNEDAIVLVPETADFFNNIDTFESNKLSTQKDDILHSAKDKFKRIQIKKVENWLNGCEVPETNFEDEYSEDEFTSSKSIKMDNSDDKKLNAKFSIENDSPKKFAIVTTEISGASVEDIDPDAKIIDNIRVGNEENLNEFTKNKNLNKAAVEKCMVADDTWQQSPSLISQVSLTILKDNASKSVNNSSKKEQGLECQHILQISKSTTSTCRPMNVKESVYTKETEARNIKPVPCFKTKSDPNFCAKRLRHTKLSSKKMSQSKKIKHPFNLTPQPMIIDDNVLSDEVFDSPNSICNQNRSKLFQKQFASNNNNLTFEQMEEQDLSADETFLPHDFIIKSMDMDASLPQVNCTTEQSFRDPDNDMRIANKENFNDFSEQSSEDLLQELKMTSPDTKKLSDNHDTEAIAIPLEKRKNLVDSFDLLLEPAQQLYKYKEDPVRKKADRKNLPGHDCKLCEKYYRELGLSDGELKERLRLCSRHKANNVPPPTPEHYWELDFPDTPECKARGYLNATQRVQLKSRRRQPLK